MARFCVLIPAYKPDEKLIALLKEIAEKTDLDVVIVDDGSGEAFTPVFEAAKAVPRCHVIRYEKNGGKGHALKVGLQYCVNVYGKDETFTGVVTADADGQHLLKDILRVGEALSVNGKELVLGVRTFTNKIPLRSQFGNKMTILVYRLASGISVSDTQTGLRGLPASALPEMIVLEGERYEYEMTMLLRVKKMGLTVKEIPIETVYIDDNSSSHFNPLKDSIRIYKMILKQAYLLKYTLSSFAAFCVDYLIYALLFGFGTLTSLNAQIPARVISSIFNFIVNKRYVFDDKDAGAKKTFLQGLEYFLLVVFNLFVIARPLNGLLISLGVTEYLSQPIANLIQFIVSYGIQRFLIFARKKKQKK